MKREFQRLPVINRRKLLKDIGLIAVGAIGGSLLICRPDEQSDQPKQFTDEQIYKALTGERIQSKLEDVVMQTFGIKLRVPENEYNSNGSFKDVDRGVVLLKEIEAVNPSLVNAAKGLDVFVLPSRGDYLRIMAANYRTPLDSNNSLEYLSGGPDSLQAWLDALTRSRAAQLGKEFLLGWRKIVGRSGFRYDSNLKYTDENGFRVISWGDWKHNKSEPQGIFPNPEASMLLEDGLPFKHIAEIYYNMYENSPFFANSKKAYDSYQELFKYALDSCLFTKKEYEHASKLLQPFAVIEQKKTWKQKMNLRDKIAVEWGVSWRSILKANGIYNLDDIEKPIQVIIPLERDIDMKATDQRYAQWVSHTVTEDDSMGLGVLAEKLRGKHRFYLLTPEFIKSLNPRIKSIDDIQSGWNLNFPVPVNGMLLGGTMKYVQPLIKSSRLAGIMYCDKPFAVGHPLYFS